MDQISELPPVLQGVDLEVDHRQRGGCQRILLRTIIYGPDIETRSRAAIDYKYVTFRLK